MNCATHFKTSRIRTALFTLLSIFALGGVADSQTVSALKYDWKVGDEFWYDVEVSSGRDGKESKLSGLVTYQVTRDRLVKVQAKDATGTAFVIGSDGYLVTCADVVGDAKKVDVKLGFTKFVATVVEVDPVLGVALLKVQANNLNPIPIANADAVQGTKISAFGFTQRGVPGEKQSIATGSISGFKDNVSGRRNLQLDASMASRNSGGPVVDESGNCLGIVISQLSAGEVSKVNFAVPSSELTKLLQKHSEQSPSATRTQAVSETELAKMVNASVAMVKVKGEDRSESFQIDWIGSLGLESGHGRFVVDNNGEISDMTGDSDLPFVFGSLAKIAIEPLGGSNAPRWESLRERKFAYGNADPRSKSNILDRYRIEPADSRQGRPSSDELGFEIPSRYRSRNARRIPRLTPPRVTYPHQQTGDSSTKAPMYSESERAVFEPDVKSKSKAGRVLLKKTSEMYVGKQGTPPSITLTSSGTIEFDTQQHLPVSAQLSGTLTSVTNGKVISLPVKLTYRKIEDAVVAARKKKAADAKQASREAAKKRATIPDPKAVKTLLAKIKSDPHLANSKLLELKKLAPVDGLREDVLKTLQSFCKSKSFHVHRFDDVFSVLDKYGYSEKHKVEMLLTFLDSSNKTVDRWSIGQLNKLPVVDEFRGRVLEIAETNLGTAKDRYAKAELKKLLARWAKEGDDSSLVVLADIKRSLDGDMSSYDRRRELESLMHVKLSESTRPELTEIAEKTLLASGKDTSLRDVAAKLVLHCATPEDQLSIFCDYLVDVENELRNDELKKVYDVLVASKTELAQQVLIVRLKKEDYNKFESKALIKMGSDCEDMLLKASKTLPWVKSRLPSILDSVGTEKSIAVLERIELDCHDSYERDKIHKSRMRLLKRLQVDSTTAGGKGDASSNAANKLGEMFGD